MGSLATAVEEADIDVEQALRAGIGSLSETRTAPVDVGAHRELLDAAIDRFEAFDSHVDVIEAAITDVVREDSNE